jgi:2-polyprenyl-3-methyl-5-hydroxy-6-metoxy-1,4-benzoquinol methylase
MTLQRHKRDWEDLGGMDPLWAVLSDPDKQYGGWSEAEFFQTGDAEIRGMLEAVSSVWPDAPRGRALDFGCGVGRLTRALAKHFAGVTGVDISQPMIARATELNQFVASCSFVLNTADNLAIFEDESFDLIYSCKVLQHQPNAAGIVRYVQEFVRMLSKNGIAVFQIPSALPVRFRLNWRRWAYTAMRSVGFQRDYLYRRLHLNPIKMTTMKRDAVRRAVEAAGGRVLDIRVTDDAGPRVESLMYYVVRQGASGRTARDVKSA